MPFTWFRGDLSQHFSVFLLPEGEAESKYHSICWLGFPILLLFYILDTIFPSFFISLDSISFHLPLDLKVSITILKKIVRLLAVA